ncbi:MAG: hypothetical protein K8R53_10090, partial [Bacteroidales bacterium]|nr:hypothetical protein [Bacteroidales bacterium]
MNKLYKHILFFVAVLFFYGCSYEWKIARSYVESGPDLSMLILPVDFVFKSNLKTKEVNLPSGISGYEKDS